MTTSEAIKELTNYQRWRMGEDIPQPNPRKITDAILFAIDLMKKLK